MSKEKECSRCGEIKPLDDFYRNKRSKDGRRGICKACNAIDNKIYGEENKEMIAAKAKIFRQVNKEAIRKTRKIWTLNNKDRIAETTRVYNIKNKDKLAIQDKEWKKNNPDKVNRYQRETRRRRILKDDLFVLKVRVSHAIRQGITRNGYAKKSKSLEILGCTFEEFKAHIELGFKKYPGMCWERFSEIHLDHIFPVSKAKTEEEMYKLNRYTNFQPLWAVDNMKKSDKIIEGTQLILV